MLTGVKLTWTATGDDGNEGAANAYDLRYSKSPISDANWQEATQAANLPAPQPAGTGEAFTLTGLDPTTTYYIALRVLDNVGNESDLSNVVIATTSSGTVLFEDDMEDGPGDWTVKGTNDLWHLSEHRSNSPSAAWYYGQEGSWNYDTGSANNGTLTSPPIELGDADDALLVYYEWSEVESGASFDRTRLQISTDGVKWETIFETHGTEDKWVKRQVSLEPYVKKGGTIHFRYWFDTIDDKFNNFEGWYIDDVQVLVAKEDQVETQPLPNLVMQEANIGINPAQPIDGDPVTINAVVLNSGSADANEVLVQFVDVTDGVTLPIGELQVIATIPAGASGVAQAIYDSTGRTGDRDIQVVVDPHNFVAESNESDNKATKKIAITAPPKPNLVMTTANIGFDPPEPSDGDPVTINATVLNTGATDASDVVVQFVDGTGVSSAPIDAPQVLDSIPAGGSATVQITYDTTGLSGSRTIEVIVDPNNAVPETDLSDNSAKATLKMIDLPAPNLVVQAANIGFNPANPTVGHGVIIHVTVLNDGAVDAAEVLIQFVDATNSGLVPIGQQQVIEAIPAGGSGTAQVEYDTSGRVGDRKIQVIADPFNFIPETKETDNEAKGTLTIAAPPLPNLALHANNIGFNPPTPTPG
ncbi:MAG: hypothetical protein HC802_03510 [Caldilineaceae bacterium]|nr:hypothetical protein [Caldilineaceae bacterium]